MQLKWEGYLCHSPTKIYDALKKLYVHMATYNISSDSPYGSRESMNS